MRKIRSYLQPTTPASRTLTRVISSPIYACRTMLTFVPVAFVDIVRTVFAIEPDWAVTTVALCSIRTSTKRRFTFQQNISSLSNSNIRLHLTKSLQKLCCKTY